MVLKEQKPIDARSIVNTTRYNREQMWKNGLLEFFRKVNSTVARRPVPVKWVDMSGLSQAELSSIAYTDGETIFINPTKFRAFKNAIHTDNILSTVGAIAEIKGASYHELAHILWTPRKASEPTKTIAGLAQVQPFSTIFRSYNILEDQRIETRFVAKYRGSEGYFISMASSFIYNDDACKQNPAMVFILSYGRRFLDRSIVSMSEKLFEKFIHDENMSVSTQEIKDLIDEYRLLVFPRNHVRGTEIVKRFDEIMRIIEKTNENTDGDGGGGNPGGQEGGQGDDPGDGDGNGGGNQIPVRHNDSGGQNGGGHGSINKGTPVRTSEQDEDVERQEKYDQEKSGSGSDDSADDEEDSDSGSDEPASNDGSSKEPGTGSQEDGEGSSGEQGKKRHAVFEKLLEEGKRGTDIISQDAFDSVKTIVKTVQKARMSAKPNLKNCVPTPTTPIMRGSSKKIQDAFNLIRADGEDVWESGMSNGRLNTGQAMNARKLHLNVFDQFVDLGDDANSFEVVLLIDQSGSMNGFKQEAVSQGLWIIRNACSALDIPITVIGYDDDAWLLFSSETPAKPHEYMSLDCRGGTSPNPALLWALNIFSTSEAKNKLLFTLTDGQWYMSNGIIDSMKSINGLGVHTTLVVQGEPRRSTWNQITGKYEIEENVVFEFPQVGTDPYGHQRMVKCGDAQRELPNLVSKVIKQIAVEIINNR